MGIRATQIKGRTSFLHVFFTRGSWISTNTTWTAWKSPSFIDKLWIYSLSWKPESMEKKKLPETNQQRVYIPKIGCFFETSLENLKAKRQAAPFFGPRVVFRRSGFPPPCHGLRSSSPGASNQNSTFFNIKAVWDAEFTFPDKRSPPFWVASRWSTSIGLGRDLKPLKLMAGSEAEIALFFGGQEKKYIYHSGKLESTICRCTS